MAFLVSSVLWFTMMMAFWFILPITIFKKSITFQQRLKATFGKEEFTIENEKGSRSWLWREFTATMESPHFFHLYFDERSFFIVPKEAFLDEEVPLVRKLLAAKISADRDPIAESLFLEVEKKILNDSILKQYMRL